MSQNTSSEKSLARIQTDPIIIFPKIPNVKRLPEFFQFAQWLATPSDQREHKTQKEFAEVIRIDQDTLTLWKSHPQLWTIVQSLIRSQIREKTADIIDALCDKAIGKGTAAEAALALRIAGFMNPKEKK
ncbi:MAG: hypothetical protein WCT40_04340 [Candidatus Magasanikbacteria bacterium]